MPRLTPSPHAGTPCKGFLQRLRRLVTDRRGVGGIEFAIVAPLLIMTYIGAFEITLGVTVARKVSRASSNVSDLLTRNDTVDTAMLNAMKEVTRSVVAPFKQDYYSLTMTGIAVDATGKATVAWSYAWKREKPADPKAQPQELSSKPYTKGDVVDLPDDVEAKSSFLVRTEFEMKHTILLMAPNLSSQLNEIKLGKTSFFRQRKGEAITCTGC